MSRRVGWIAIGLVGAAAVAGGASALRSPGGARLEDIPPGIESAIGDWAMCRSTYIGERIHDDITPDRLVDSALELCAGEERRVGEAFDRAGGAWTGKIAEFRRRYRASLIDNVIRLRSGLGPADPQGAWGFCAAQNLRPTTTSAADFETAFDSALAACAEFEEAVRKELGRVSGAANVESNLRIMKDFLRGRARNSN
jgi:hypothetical protein